MKNVGGIKGANGGMAWKGVSTEDLENAGKGYDLPCPPLLFRTLRRSQMRHRYIIRGNSKKISELEFQHPDPTTDKITP